MHLTALIFAVTGTLTVVHGLGINCRGSLRCGGSGILDAIHTAITNLPQGNTYSNGQHIACDGNICAFYQNLQGSQTAVQAAGQVQDLINHGCTVCGSDPTNPGNDVSTGELTVNYVTVP
ncbi:killer toxin, kp4 [Usnea florida]